MLSDHHFPQYHVRPPSGFVNDPNGPVPVDGEFHLYFQYRHATDGSTPVMWGHATSHDLAIWTLHRPAISPEPTGVDRDGSWSGNTVLYEGDVVAFYSAYQARKKYQSVVSARSRDGGYSFEPATQVVPDPEPSEGVVTFRDPFVWRDAERWLMAVGSGDVDEVASVRLYASQDLRTWTYLGHLAESARHLVDGWDTGAMWECPQVLSFGDRRVVLVGAWAPVESIMHVLCVGVGPANEDGIPPRIDRYDNGRNFNAASVKRESPWGPIVWGWATEGREPVLAAAADWSGMLTLPRTVALGSDGRVRSQPVPSMLALRRERHLPSGRDGTDGGRGFFRIGSQFEIDCVLQRREAGDPATTLRLQFATDEYLDVVCDWRSAKIWIDRNHASLDPRAHIGRFSFSEEDLRAGDGVSLRLFVDGSIAELFTSSGRCATVRFYPTTPPPWAFLFLDGQPDDRVNVWRLGTT